MEVKSFGELANAITSLTDTINRNNQALSEKIHNNKLDQKLAAGEISEEEAFADRVDFVKGKMITCYCAACGRSISLHEKMSYGYCQHCGEKVEKYDCESGNFSKEALKHVPADLLYELGALKTRKRDDLIEAAAEKGHCEANIYLAVKHIKNGDYITALKYGKSANKNANGDALCIIAVCEIVNDATFDEAEKKLEKAIKLGISNPDVKIIYDTVQSKINDFYEEQRETQWHNETISLDNFDAAAWNTKVQEQYNRMLGIDPSPTYTLDDCDDYGRPFGSPGIPGDPSWLDC